MARRKSKPKKLSKGQLVFTKKGKLASQAKPKKTKPSAKLQDYIASEISRRGKPAIKQGKQLTQREATIRGSAGQVGTNVNLPKGRRNVRYGETTGKGGPNAEIVRKINKRFPMAVTDTRQLLTPTTDNRLPRQLKDEYHKVPMQEITNTRGGFHSGRVRSLI